ncbi:hypothetical protein BGZ76_009185 [Entomortierella beljakovae]|nr:hypothetical protein BGZ76_009185 [Entomortierella beljakovae]
MSTGFTVLEHDLLPQEVDVSTSGILPLVYASRGLTIESIAKCLGDATPFKEGAGTFVLNTPANNQTTSIISTTSVSSISALAIYFYFAGSTSVTSAKTGATSIIS